LSEVAPEKWLTAKEVGAALGVNEDTVLRWWSQGFPNGREIPAQYHQRWGFVRHLFHPQLVDFLNRELAALD
jgi:hypothetical protein